ncbi:unnamed protein product [Urochloa decumbens]|uniref:Uncharacterized protein n=1 Tax=Urochloa decumbens TaxID=240449 RepID=A0ABC8W264_9POAL
MAYRRKQGMQRSATFVEDHRQASSGGPTSPAIASPRATRFADDNRRPDRSSSRLAAQAAASSSSAALGDLTLPAFGDRLAAAAAVAAAASHGDSQPSSPMQDPVTQLYTSTTKLNDDGPKYDLELSKKEDARHGFWSLVAQKAKVMLDENGTPRTHPPSESRWSYDRVQSSEGSPTSRKGPPSEGRIDIGGKIKNVLEQEGLAVADVNAAPAPAGGVAAVKKLQIRRKACSMDFRSANLVSPESPLQPDVESPQIKASRDVANAMSAKVKLLQRELKTLKADLAFSKERCAQLEEENRQLRDGNHDADEDMIRQQLETLLAEKARVAHENTMYARENRFLREIVEYHQLNMQDVVNLDEEEDDDDDYIEEEDEDDLADDDDAEQEYQDRGASSPSHPVLQEEEEAEQHQAAGPDTGCPQSPSSQRQTESQLPPRVPSTDGGGGGGDAMEHESPEELDTNGGGAMDHGSPRKLDTNSEGGTVEYEQPRLLSTNSGVITHDESSDDHGSSPETTRDG